MCNVFKSDFSYFFYGWLVYCFKGDFLLLDVYVWLVVFVFKNIIENFLCLVFLFDSGVFRSGCY